uniref:AT-HSFC1 n=1 Tax=Arundo donax TaxID=35708 RepID=A0A0A9HJP0_ARUDO
MPMPPPPLPPAKCGTCCTPQVAVGSKEGRTIAGFCSTHCQSSQSMAAPPRASSASDGGGGGAAGGSGEAVGRWCWRCMRRRFFSAACSMRLRVTPSGSSASLSRKDMSWSGRSSVACRRRLICASSSPMAACSCRSRCTSSSSASLSSSPPPC